MTLSLSGQSTVQFICITYLQMFQSAGFKKVTWNEWLQPPRMTAQLKLELLTFVHCGSQKAPNRP